MIGVRHFGIVVSDLEKALHFYRDLLGLVVVRSADEQGEYLDRMLALSEARVLTAKLGASTGETLVELLEFKSHRAEESKGPRLVGIGPTHVAFTVCDLDGLFLRLRGASVPFNAPPQLAPDGKAKVTFCFDPDGTPIELVEELRLPEIPRV